MFNIEETVTAKMTAFVEREYVSSEFIGSIDAGCMDCSNSCAENCAAKCKKNSR